MWRTSRSHQDRWSRTATWSGCPLRPDRSTKRLRITPIFRLCRMASSPTGRSQLTVPLQRRAGPSALVRIGYASSRSSRIVDGVARPEAAAPRRHLPRPVDSHPPTSGTGSAQLRFLPGGGQVVVARVGRSHNDRLSPGRLMTFHRSANGDASREGSALIDEEMRSAERGGVA